MKPKNVVVTGGNSGVGYETVKGLYEEGHNVIFGSRNVSKNQEAVAEITKKAGGSLTSFPLDLSVRKSVEQFAKNVMAKFDHIDILVNNAGLLMSGDRQVSELGIEMTLAINHFGPFYLTYLLWGAICKSSQARIINVSSFLHYRAPSNYLQDIECSNKTFINFTQLSISKLFNVLFTQGLFSLLQKKSLPNIKTVSMHPGLVDTNFGQGSSLFKCFKCFCCCMIVDQVSGSRTSLFLARLPFGDIRNGEYYDQDTRVKEMDQRGRRVEDVEALWRMSQKVYGINFR